MYGTALTNFIDAGVDDAFALGLALKFASNFHFEVRLVSTVFGNCSLLQVAKNVSKIRAACDLNHHTGPPIVYGCEHPIIKETIIDATYFHGLDGLGNNNLPDEEIGTTPDNIAAQEIIRVCLEAKEKNVKVTLVMLGPLTNLAKAIQLKEDIVTDIDRIVIMGGAGSGHGNVGRVTEFNIHADCEAAAIVFSNLSQCNRICTIVSWELTLAATIPWEVFDSLNEESNASKSRVCRSDSFCSIPDIFFPSPPPVLSLCDFCGPHGS
jgi:purine nucleosidase